MKDKKTEKKSSNKYSAILKYKKYAFIFLYFVFAVLAVIASAAKWSNSAIICIGAILLILSFAVLIRPLLTKEKIDIVEAVFIIIDSFILIAAVVTYAYNPPKENEPDKSGVVQILAAVIGGLITLYGVGLTIKFNRVAKEEDEINKAKPNVFPVSDEVWEQLPEAIKIERNVMIHSSLTNLEKAKRTDVRYSIAPVYLENSDLSMCTFKGIGINDNSFIVFNFDNVVLKGSANCFCINYQFKFDKEIESVQLVLSDMYNNIYSCYVSFMIDDSKKRKNKTIYVYGVLKTELMNADKYEMFSNVE